MTAKCSADARIWVILTTGLMSGRPFGGAAVMVRQGIVPSCSRIPIGNPRITCVCLENPYGPDILISSVYMPWYDRSF